MGGQGALPARRGKGSARRASLAGPDLPSCFCESSLTAWFEAGPSRERDAEFAACAKETWHVFGLGDQGFGNVQAAEEADNPMLWENGSAHTGVEWYTSPLSHQWGGRQAPTSQRFLDICPILFLPCVR